MAASVKEFLETYDLYQTFWPGNAVGWRGGWPAEVEAPCPGCGEKRPHRVWPTKVAGATREWAVYMLQGACDHCSTDGVLFWVEVNQRETWMRKVGQVPPAPLPTALPAAARAAN